MYSTRLRFHFIGIGGVGMSGLAEILVRQGFQLSGSDVRANDATERLASLGVSIMLGHDAEHVPQDTSVVVYSSAIKAQNPEVIEAHRRGVPVIPRAEVLAEVMRLKCSIAVAGSHGKTTTTSFIGTVLEAAGLDPTVIIGGQVKSFGACGKLGRGDYLVAESDESDRSFLLLRPTIAVLTNIDAEHLEAYSSFEDLEGSFRQFMNAVPFYGLAIFCLDDPRVYELAAVYRRRKITYGFHKEAEVRASRVLHRREYTCCVVEHHGIELGTLTLPMLGAHMLLNSLAAVAIGLEFGIGFEKISRALQGFSGVRRRLEVIGQARGITVMSDYAHHPTEIRATLSALRAGWGKEARIRCIFQPHRHTRTRDCFAAFLDAFSECDEVLVTEIYGAGEDTIAGVSGALLAEALRHPQRSFLTHFEMITEYLEITAAPGDIIICLGAGSIGAYADSILGIISARVADECDLLDERRHAL